MKAFSDLLIVICLENCPKLPFSVLDHEIKYTCHIQRVQIIVYSALAHMGTVYIPGRIIEPYLEKIASITESKQFLIFLKESH